MSTDSGGQRPRIAPGTTAEIGRLNALIAAVIGRVSGSRRPPNLFTTLARHRRLFLPWLRFAGALMPGGSLPREDSELVILRVAHSCGCDYEWHHHERLAPASGLPAAVVQLVREGPEADGFTPRQRLLLRAADALHADRDIDDELWAELSGELRDHELIELCMLVGHYEMLAMTLNALRVEPDAFDGGGPSRLLNLVSNLRRRRR
jgi:alkylhydroperoxidase family enzyme